MADERNRGSGNGGGVRDGDDVDHDFARPEEPTVVEVSRDFLIGSLGRAASALYGAGDVCLESRALVTSGAGKAGIADLIDELRDLNSIIAGMVRALERLEFKEDP